MQTTNQDANNMAMLCHLSAFLVFFTGIGGVLGPLIIWLLKRDQYPEVDHHGKEAINFNILILIGYLICVPFIFLLFIGLFMMGIIFIAHILFTLQGAIAASRGQIYKYPFTVKILK